MTLLSSLSLIAFLLLIPLLSLLSTNCLPLHSHSRILRWSKVKLDKPDTENLDVHLGGLLNLTTYPALLSIFFFLPCSYLPSYDLRCRWWNRPALVPPLEAVEFDHPFGSL